MDIGRTTDAGIRLYQFLVYETPVQVRVLVQHPLVTRSVISTANAPLRIGTTATLPLAEALYLESEHHAIIQLPEFLQSAELQRLLNEEKDTAALCPLPRCFFGASRILLDELQHRPEMFAPELLDEIFRLRHQLREERRAKIEAGQRTNMTLDEMQGCAWMQLE